MMKEACPVGKRTGNKFHGKRRGRETNRRFGWEWEKLKRNRLCFGGRNELLRTFSGKNFEFLN